MEIPDWVREYVGIPYANCDCAQLVRWVLMAEFNQGVRLPETHWPIISPSEQKAWILRQGYEVQERQDGDVALMCTSGAVKPDYHVGVVVGDKVLHSVSPIGGIVSPIRLLGAMGIHLLGYYRCKPIPLC